MKNQSYQYENIVICLDYNGKNYKGLVQLEDIRHYRLHRVKNEFSDSRINPAGIE